MCFGLKQAWLTHSRQRYPAQARGPHPPTGRSHSPAGTSQAAGRLFGTSTSHRERTKCLPAGGASRVAQFRPARPGCSLSLHSPEARPRGAEERALQQWLPDVLSMLTSHSFRVNLKNKQTIKRRKRKKHRKTCPHSLGSLPLSGREGEHSRTARSFSWPDTGRWASSGHVSGGTS